MPPWLFKASSSDTVRVMARLIPDVASVIPNRYTDIISWYTPSISVPIFLEIYTLKYISIILKIREVTTKTIVFIIKTLNRFKKNLQKKIHYFVIRRVYETSFINRIMNL